MSQVPQPTLPEAEAQMAAGQIPVDVIRWRQFFLLFLYGILHP